MSVGAEKLLEQGEAHLAARNLEQATFCFSKAEVLGASADYCAGRRWTCYMLAGDYELAWQQSDAIRARGASDPHRVWDGTRLANKSVMVRSVHGFGDAVQMLRYAPWLRREAARLTIQVAPELVELARCVAGIDEVVAWGDERPHDVQLEITELPYAHRSTLGTLPAASPYLHLPSAVHADACRLLGQRRRPRVGLVWSSSPWDSTRSMPISFLRSLILARNDIDFWSLQPTTGAWKQFCEQNGLPLRSAGDLPVLAFAGCVAQMDLLITVDSFAAHLAGALGTPAWVLLKQQADWRWMIGREDSPWYPTHRLFRQETEGAWESVATRVTQALTTWSDANENQLASNNL